LPVQYGMVLNNLRFPGDGVDVLQITLDWPEPLHPEPFEQAWRDVLRSNPVLRTGFELDDEYGLVQVVQPTVEPDIRRREPASPTGAEFEEFLRADRRIAFEVSRPPLIRLTVLGQPACRVVATFEHALLDGRSMRLLVEELSLCYAGRLAGRPVTLPARPPFREFVRWWQQADDPTSESFWTDHLTGAVLPRSLPGYLPTRPIDRPASAAQAEPCTVELSLTRADSDRIRRLGQELRLSASTVLTAGWALLRARYGGVDDVVLALTRSCRPASIPDADRVMGPLINTVPLRVRIDPDGSVEQLLTAVNEALHQLRRHQLSPLTSILGWAGLPADTTLIDSLVMFDRRQLASALPELAGSVGPAAPVSARVDRLPSYPLTVYAYDEPELRLGMIVDGRRFVDGAVQRMLEQLRTVLIELSGDQSTAVADLSLGANTEAELRAGWNRTATGAYQADSTVPGLFAEQVARNPGAPAVESADGSWSYAELDRYSSTLAAGLRRLGVRTGAPVAVVLPRSAAQIGVLLAVLKAGGAYLAIDPGSPPARLASLIADAKAALVVGQVPVAMPGVSLVAVDELLAAGTAGTPPTGLVHPLSLAYLSYTSGSTGRPKAVAVPHRAVVRLISRPTFVKLGLGERVLQLAPTAFDAATLEIWGALLTGATLVLAPPGPLGLPELAALLRTARPSVCWLTAGLFHQLVELDAGALAGIDQLLTGGDVLDPGAVRAALSARGGRPLINGYGPTENTTFTTCHRVHASEPLEAGVPIGRPIQHTTVQVLDAQLRPVPVGVAGELYTGGDGLAQGYYGDPAGTARAFVPDPDGVGGRLYRTGDLARWRADGVLEFLGRVDDQVKIRGFRVEPGEVEAVLRGFPGVAGAAVVARGDAARRQLVGYVTPADGVPVAALRPAALREYLAQRLPDYLVPDGFAVLERFPLNSNGKLDRGALPEPAREARPAAEPPRGDTEQRLAELWTTLLAGEVAEDIGRDDSFFALGGNSLSAARLMFRIREVFGVDLSMAAFYRAPTVAGCAAAVNDARSAGTGVPAISRRPRAGYRVASERPAGLAPHLVRLTEDWALWRTVCLRAAGFDVGLLDSLGDPVLAALADAANGAEAADARADAAEAYRAEFPAAVRRSSQALHRAASLPALREAVAWQNRHALTTGIDALVRSGPQPASRNTKHRQHEALVASYLQRYCAKNDTIGFFGPVGWSVIDDGPGIRVSHAGTGPIRARTTYLEGWAVRAVMADHQEALRPWLVPRRMPFIDVRPAEQQLLLPLAPPAPLTTAEAAILRACDGVRDATTIAELVLADPSSGLRDVAEVFAVLGQLSDNHRLAWQVDLAPQDIRPERSMAAILARVSDPAVRAPAEATLNALTEARDGLAAAAGDPRRVADAMAELESTFTRITGAASTRRAGALYAGRTLAYEECLRADTVRLGSDALDGIRDALGLVLASARWFTAECGAHYAELFERVYRQRAAQLATAAVPLADLWLITNDALFAQPPALIEPAIRELQQRWSAILGLASMRQRRVRLRSADLRAAVAAEFPWRPRVWPMAVHHSPDLMIAEQQAVEGGRPLWVLGEIHPSIVTTRYATWLAFHDDPAGMRAALRQDVGARTVFLAETAEEGGVCARLSNVLTTDGDLRLVFAHDSSGYRPEASLVVGQCEVIDSSSGLRVRCRDGSLELGLLEVLGDLLTAVLAQSFHLVPPAAHRPRIQIDDLVVSRESWTLSAAEPPFADTADEGDRYRQARAWAARHGLPRQVFLRFTGERKPIFADLTSLASIDLIARGLRRCRRAAGDQAGVSIVEMLPRPEQAWLADAEGRRYTAELRMVAVDQKLAG
jgi:amino acid adenylation domain-containing protein